MHRYDTVLKSLLQDSQNSLLERITGAKIGQWLNVELPEVTQTRVDLLGETAGDKRLVGFELQSVNDHLLPLRMAEYCLRVYRLHRRFPEQYVLYVGNAKLRMPSHLDGPAFHCHYKIIDIRDIAEESLLHSPHTGDHILAILANHPDGNQTIRRILEKLATLEGAARKAAFQELFILAGLRKLGKAVRQEAKRMPILDDIMTHDVLGPTYRKGLQQGIQKGLEKAASKANSTSYASRSTSASALCLPASTSASKNSPPPQSKKSPCAFSTPKPWQISSPANARPALIPAPLLLAQKPNCDTTGMVL